MKASRFLIIFLLLNFLIPLIVLAGDSKNPQHWYERALVDFESAKLLNSETAYNSQVCFLAHQAIEKQIKGKIYEHGKVPDRHHYTLRLFERVAKSFKGNAVKKRDLKWIDGLYISSRYPKTNSKFNPKMASRCLAIAKEIVGRHG